MKGVLEVHDDFLGKCLDESWSVVSVIEKTPEVKML